MTENEISKIVFECALKVHKNLGPGLLESAYEECLFYELKKSNLFVEKQKALPLIYEEVKLDVGYRIDLIVENKFIIEVKSVETLNEVEVTNGKKSSKKPTSSSTSNSGITPIPIRRHTCVTSHHGASSAANSFHVGF